MLTRREIIVVKVESAYNTDATPGATDAILVEDLSWSNAGARMNERPATRPSLGKLQQVFGGTLLQIQCTAEIKGPGAAYSASVRPEIDALLRACAAGVTVVTTPGSETATYKPVSSGHESVTIYLYRDGKRMIVTGCRGGPPEFIWEAGKVGKVKFTLTGHVAAETDTALITPTFDSVIPPVFKAGAFAIGAYSAIINALNVNGGNKLAMPGNVSASDGYGEIRIVERNVTGSFDPEDVLVATYPFLANWKAGTTAALATGTIGATQYNKYAMSLPVVYSTELAPGDRDGIRTLQNTFAAAESAGDDEWSLAFS